MCRPAGSKGHVTLDMATPPTGRPKKVPSTDTSGRTAQARRWRGPCSLLSCSVLITPSLGPGPPLARNGQGSLKLRPVLASEVPLLVLVPHYHGQSLDPSRYRSQCPTGKAATSPQQGRLSMGAGGGLPGGPPSWEGFPDDKLKGGALGRNCVEHTGAGPSLSCSVRGGAHPSPACCLPVLRQHPDRRK